MKITGRKAQQMITYNTEIIRKQSNGVMNLVVIDILRSVIHVWERKGMTI